MGSEPPKHSCFKKKNLKNFFTKFVFDFSNDSVKHILRLVQDLESTKKGYVISMYKFRSVLQNNKKLDFVNHEYFGGSDASN